MTKVTLTVDLRLDSAFFEDLLDTAGYSIGYWADRASIEVKDEHGDEIFYRVSEQDGEEFLITKGDMESTIGDIVSGKFGDVNRVLKNDLVLLCLGDDDIDIDATAADQLIQFACFKELRYA